PGTPEETATTMEFVLEALHQNSLIGKDFLEVGGAAYSDIMGSVLSSLGSMDDDDFDDEDDDDLFRNYR
ncbi:MAG: magnesium chelatase, partial [Bacteroidetes bacterium]|nr:magnesium chelatase [Bacteroidota bacterium]